MSTSVLRLLCRHKKSDASATYHMHALYLRPAVPLRCSLRNGHLVPKQRRFDYSSQRETGGPPLRRPHRSYGTASKKSDNPTHLDFISLGFGDVSPNLLQSHASSSTSQNHQAQGKASLPSSSLPRRSCARLIFVYKIPPTRYLYYQAYKGFWITR